jgi:hypothetical protein
MAETKKYLHNIDVVKNKLTNFILNPATTAQRIAIGLTLTTTHQGYVVFDIDDNAQYFWDGTQWVGNTTTETDPIFSAWLLATPPLYSYTETDPVWLADKPSYLTSAAAALAYEPIITSGTTGQYWRGDKTWQTFPTIPAAQIQSDWNQTNNTLLDYIKNKPTIPTVGTWGALNYPSWTSGTPFVKMTAAGTFALDTNSYLTSAITSLGGLTGATQTFGNDTNVTMVSSGTTHTLTWAGTLADARIASASTWNGKQAALNGTGFVKASGTTISYDNSTYLTAAVTSIATAGLISGGTITGTGTITTSMATGKLVGRSTAGTGVMEEITVGTGLSLSGGTLNATAQSVGFEQNFLLMGA